MTRTKAREIAVGLIYALSVGEQSADELLESFFEGEHYATLADEDELYDSRPDKKQSAYISELVTSAAEHLPELDGYIQKYSVGWKPERISRTALAALRCALCEILYMSDAPTAAAINECVELAKGYEEPDTVAFINGVLGAFMRGENRETEE